MRNRGDEPWTADIEGIYHSIHEITPHDEATFRDADYSERQLREAFEEGFISSEVTSDDRKVAREEFFRWMEYLGYDRNEFDWEAWKEWAGYGDD